MLESLPLALYALFAPVVSALLIAAICPLRRHGWGAAWLSTGTALSTLAAAVLLLVQQEPGAVTVWETSWLPGAGASIAQVGVQLDGTAVLMLLVVTGVASAVQVFSLGYMAHEPRSSIGRYFLYHSLFIFSMNLLVIAPNLLQLFVGWELVGLTSYLLIGFYVAKPSAGHAAVKAFWVTKFADMGLLLGLLLLFVGSGTFAFQATLPEALATAVTLLLFLAVVGKSAQFPLHVWLPNAMEGPTPVSALLHAATMVAAGVYLLVRAAPLFAQAPLTGEVMVYVGSFSALFASVLALQQTDIKKVLAYSTCSQLGYMVAAAGVGAPVASFFHLTTHAFFKALLFLAAGSLIHAVHSNELTDMGGLRKKMPLTMVTFTIGALALAGVPGFSGFFSKDLILEEVALRGQWVPLGMLLVSAFLTAFYMGRVLILAFFGEPSEKAHHAHESGPSMAIPLVVLAVPALLAGFAASSMAELQGEHYSFHMGAVGLTATGAGLAGLVLSYFVFSAKTVQAGAWGWVQWLGVVGRSGAVDRVYRFGFFGLTLPFARAIGWFDRYVIDGLMNFTAWCAMRLSQRLRQVQTGNALDYVFAIMAGAVLLTVWGMYQ